MIHLILRLGFFVTFVVGQNLVNVRFPQGELEGDAPNGSQVYFDAPLRADPKNAGQITVEIVDEAAKQAFGVFPTVLSSGDAFALILRDGSLIPLMDDVNVFEVSVGCFSNHSFYLPFQLKSSYLDSDLFDSQTFSLFVKILKPNLEIPRFLKAEQSFKLSQRLTEGIVGKIDIKNLDKTDLDKFNYEIYGGFSELFSVKTAKEGLFLLTTGCEPEVCLNLPSNFTLMLRITPNDGRPTANQTEITLVHLLISKENILGPHFLEREYSASIVERSDHFLAAVQLQAIDPDYLDSQDEKINFAFSEPSEVFEVDSESGIVKIKNSSLVTIENLGQTVKLMVEVGDGKNPADIAVVEIQIIKAESGEESAEVEEFEFERPIYAFAVAPREKTVGKVELVDGNRGNIKLVEGGAGNFHLDDKTGQLDYVGTVEKDTKNYTLKIIAFPDVSSSLIATTTAQILVAGIGSSSPSFEDDFATVFVDSDAKPETVIHQLIAEDLDKDAALVFSLENSTCRDVLSTEVPCKNELVLHPNGQIVVKKLGLDLLTTTMVVSVTDKTHKLENKDFVEVLITIRRQKPKIDVGKVFKFFNSEDPLILSDDLPVGSYVFTAALEPLKADSLNELKPKIKFLLPPTEKRFRIDENSGMIYTLSSLKNAGSLNLTFRTEILVEENMKKKKLEVDGFVVVETVKMEADPPNFKENKELRFTVKENSEPDSLIGKVEVLENDGGKISFEIVDSSGQTQNLVKIDKNGKLVVGGQIDYETTPEMLFFVRITNEMEKSATIPASQNHGFERQRQQANIFRCKQNAIFCI
uniref:Cadherin domain-containing protein n=1 Tax=Panagrolaimus sp. JU765 TaxID=591449 RepID=A0AC34QNI5_9BILA